jgi:hypothetical protein
VPRDGIVCNSSWIGAGACLPELRGEWLCCGRLSGELGCLQVVILSSWGRLAWVVHTAQALQSQCVVWAAWWLLFCVAGLAQPLPDHGRAVGCSLTDGGALGGC